MAREHSHVKKRRRGCLTGCFTKIILLLGIAALLFVAACSFGVIKNDPDTGAPYVSLEGIGLGGISLDGLGLEKLDLGNLDVEALLPDGLALPAIDWPYRVNRTGLTVKTLRAGDGEAVLICSDGYTMLLGGGDNGVLLCGQLLLSGVNRLNAVVAMQSAQEQIGGLALAVKFMKPAYLLYPDTQVKTGAYNAMISAAEGVKGLTAIAPEQGLTFSLGRAQVSVIGPRSKRHTDERNDGLSIRVDYGSTSVLVMGGVTQDAEREMIHSAPVDADVLIASCGGSGEGTCAEFVEAVTPQYALLTGEEPANAVKVRLERVGAKVYTAKENGVMTVYSDGQQVTVKP